MKLYTTKVVAQYLNLTERRVRQLRDDGIISERKPGLYDLQPTITRYINYLRGNGSGKTDLNDERAKLVKAKREAAEMDNQIRRGELHKTSDLEIALSTLLMNFRTRAMALPAKLSPTLAQMGGDQPGIFDKLQEACNEMLEELSEYQTAFAAPEEAANESSGKEEKTEKE